MQIAVIGGGASGLFAALNAAWQGGHVIIFERNTALGRKLLVTGSGRCNLSNDQVGASRYTCEDPSWMESLLKLYGVPELTETFHSIGIPTYKTWDGWHYPQSDSAHSLVKTLSHAVQAAGVGVRTACQVLDLTSQRDGFLVTFLQQGNQQTQDFDKVIVASGGKAYPTLGTKGELFPILAKLGHTVRPIHPALAPVLAELGPLTSLHGVRLDLGVELRQSNTPVAHAAGNMIFTEWGLNGPAVMDISHHIPEQPGDLWEISLNLLHFVQADFNQLLTQKRDTPFPVNLLLSAFFPPKVVQCYLNLAGIPEDTPLNSLEDHSLDRLISHLKRTRLKVTGLRGYKYCQASSGGVPVSEVHPTTLESLILPGLHLTGETLDVVGPCGGFNLHFAFASGALAGKAAAQP